MFSKYIAFPTGSHANRSMAYVAFAPLPEVAHIAPIIHTHCSDIATVVKPFTQIFSLLRWGLESPETLPRGLETPVGCIDPTPWGLESP